MRKPCPTCPFLAVNAGKPNPTGFKCEDIPQAEWYAQENLDGIWEMMRTMPIAFLSCHSTDPDYFGTDGKPAYTCIGATFGVLLHMNILARLANGNYNKYVKMVGPAAAMKKKVMAEKAMDITAGRTQPAWGSMLLPKDVEVDFWQMRWPKSFSKTISLYPVLQKRLRLK